MGISYRLVFFLQTICYLRWLEKSAWTAIGMTTAFHGMHNLVPTLLYIGYRSRGLHERVHRPNPLRHRHTSFKMFTSDPVKPLRRHARIPHAVRVDDKPRSLGAQPEARRLRPHHGDTALFQVGFQVLPRLVAHLR